MEKIKKDDSYTHILKYTGIFGGVQGLNILIGVVRNKITTLLIGAMGLGLLSLFNSTINMIVSACNFGIPTSGVQDLSNKYVSESSKLLDSIKMIRSWSFLLACLGGLACIVFGPMLDAVSFSWGNHTLHYILLSPAVFFTIIGGGEMAVLKATRQLRSLALSSLAVVFFSLVFSFPIYYIWGASGIVVVLDTIALVQMLLFLHYSCRHYPYLLDITPTFLRGGLKIIKLGLAFVIAGMLSTGSEFLVRTYINNRGDLEHVGFFNAGWTLAVVYAGLIFSAMESDYFPRLSSFKEKSTEMSECVNKQMEINILLVGPILTVMLFMLPILIPLLYDSSFLAILSLSQFALVSMLFKAMYLPMEYLPLSQGKSKVFLCQEAFAVVLLVVFEMIGYAKMGLMGIGIGIALAYLLETIVVFIYTRFYFSYRASIQVWKYAAVQFFFVGIALRIVTSGCSSTFYWSMAAAVSIIAMVCTLYLLKEKTEVFDILLKKIRK